MTNKKSGNMLAIVTMMFIYAMISFVTNLAAPTSNIWKAAAFIGDCRDCRRRQAG